MTMTGNRILLTLAFLAFAPDVQGSVPVFNECFLGEGNVNIASAMRTLHAGGFNGFLIDDHVPHMIDDTPWGHRGRAFATGQMMGLLAAIQDS